ncbi:MAG: indole-3-glycerol phosphate synthase TrpC [Anaerolineales bacterium]|nr:indole-3-glycerol phosphate synthase TrpC [Anaerolineales bacterium]MDW8278541.1 indole-3-glycerol phosphate synthase TrpC [Anaerolineales bacterium]
MSILTRILDQKRLEVAALDLPALRRAAEAAPAPRDFLAAVRLSSASHSAEQERGDRLALIAELKRASPSKGMLAPHLDLLQVAEIYARNGARAVSVLTDEVFFQGHLDTLRRLRQVNYPLPLLRKEFIIHEAQLYETRAAGADAVLLIAAALPDDAHFADLHACALALGLTPLVEVHDEPETERALRLPGIRLVGINNRDLTTFHVSLETTERLRPLIPAQVTVVAESGIFTAQDVTRLARAGVDAILVGEALVTAPDIAARVRELSGAFAPGS